MPIDFPNSPSVGDNYTNSAGVVWQWDGVKWIAATLTGIQGGNNTILAIRLFTASGTYTPNALMTSCLIECVGGGAAGATANGVTTNFFTGSPGGGSGAYSRKLATVAQIGASQTVTIGAGGTPLASTGGVYVGQGGAGGDTSVGTLCIAKGAGQAGTTGNSGACFTGGAGGVTAGGAGDILAAGAPGGAGCGNSSTVNVGVSGGHGGSSAFGGGGVGGGWGGQTGGNGSAYGAGGGGASALSGGNVQGGAGSAGVVIITEYAACQGPQGVQGTPGQGMPTGGTTGQLLSKNSATNYDTTWTNQGLPSGGTTGQTLVKNSATNYDTGWTTPLGSASITLEVTLGTNITGMTAGAWNLHKFDTITTDTQGSTYSTSTGLFTPKVAGVYVVKATIAFTNAASGNVGVAIVKNGSLTNAESMTNRIGTSTNSINPMAISALINCNGTTDTISVQGFLPTGVTAFQNTTNAAAWVGMVAVKI